MSFLTDAAGMALKTIAPALGTAIAGPFGGLAAGWIAKKVLGKDNATPDEINKMITSLSDPEMASKLKAADNEFKVHMESLGVDVFRIEVDDRKSARTLMTKSNVAASMQGILATVIIAGFFYTVWMVLAGNLDIGDANKAVLIGTIIGYVSAKADQVVAFFFGSTKASQEKSDTLSDTLRQVVKR
jgi:hypothetical protein